MMLKISQKIIALSITIILTLLILLVTSNYLIQNQTRKNSELSRQDSLNSVFWDQVDKDANSLEKLLSILSKDQTLIQLFMDRDEDSLYRHSLPVFEDLKTRYGITHFYFIDTEGRVFLRAHNRPKKNDVLTRATFKQAQRTGNVSQGIEMGKSYFSLRVVMPVKVSGQIVGYFELGEELDHFIEGFKKLTQADVSLWLSTNYTKTKNLTDKFDPVSGWYRVMSSNKKQHDTLVALASESYLKNNYDLIETSYNGVEYSVKATPFKDAFGTTAGIIIISQDISIITDAFSNSIFSVSVIAIVLFIIFVFIAIKISFSITEPIRNSAAMLMDIADGEGDLTSRLDVNGQTEMSELARNFNRFVAKLHETVAIVTDSSSEVNKASQQLTSLSVESNHAVKQQKQETEIVTSSITEMAASATEVSSSASEAAEHADQADKYAENGQNLVEEMTNKINKLSEEMQSTVNVITELSSESNNIGGVLGVIKGIAEQTNLLALNAAIEAARAGEQGRGFAVVADEVRTLAQRTQESTLEIEQMIELLQSKAKAAEKAISESRDSVYNVVSNSDEANAALQAITDAVASIRKMNSHIAAASKEQSIVAESITNSIVNIQELSTNAEDYSDQMTKTCGELNNSGNRLVDSVSNFKLN